MIDTNQLQVGENLWHFAGIRVRVDGFGSLLLQFQSLDNVDNQQLVSTTMQSTTAREKFTLANFTEQRAFLKVSTTNIDEHFTINRIIVFAKPSWTQYPGE